MKKSMHAAGSAAGDNGLAGSSHYLELILDNTDHIYVVIDRNLRVITANAAALENARTLFGGPILPGEFLPIPADTKSAARINAVTDKVFAGEEIAPFFHYQPAQHEELYYEIKYIPLFDNAGSVESLLLQARNMSREKKLEAELRLRQEQFRSAFNLSAIGMALVGSDGRWIEVNKRVCAMMGYTREELLATNFQSITHPDDLDIDLQHMYDLLEGKITHYQIEKRYFQKSGATIYVQLVVTLIRDADGNPLHFVSQLKDITSHVLDSRKLKVKEVEFQALVENGSDAVVVLTEEGKPVYISPTLTKVLGYSVEEAWNLDLFSITHPDDLENVARVWKTALDRPGEAIRGYTSRMLHKDGTWRWLEDTMTNMLHEPAIGGIVDNFRDVTEQVQSRRELEKILASSLDMICTIDRDGRFLQVSQASATMLGYEPAELVGRLFFDFVHPEDVELSAAATAVIISGIETTNHQNRYIHKNGTIVPLIWSARWDSTDQIMYCIARDATEKKKSEHALRVSEERYRYLFYANPLPMWIFAVEGKRFLEVNDAAIAHYGYTREEFLSMSLFDIRPSEDIEALRGAQRIVNGSWEKHLGCWRHIRKDGEIIFVEVTSHIIDYDGQPAGLVLLNDITARLAAEEQKEFERRDKEALINSTSDMIWSVNKKLELIAANKSFLEAMKSHIGIWISPGQDMLMPELFSPKVKELWRQQYTRALTGEFFTKIIRTNVSLEGHPAAWFEVSFNPIFDDTGISGIACYGRNITEARNYQNQLLKINHQLETAQRIASLGYWEVVFDGEKVFCSAEVARIFGLESVTDLQTIRPLLARIHPEDRRRFLKAQISAARNNKHLEIEYRILTPGGELKHIYQQGWIVTDEQNVPVRLEGTVQDVTSRKRSEEMIRDSEEKNRLIMNAALDAIVCMDTRGLITFWNPQAEKTFGWKEEEVIGKRLSEIIIPAAWDKKHDEGLARYLRTGHGPALNTLLELEAKNRKGIVFPIELTVIPITQGTEKFFCGFIRDISSRKAAEDEIRTFNERLKLVSEVTSDAVWDWDLTTDQAWWNDNFYKILGYDRSLGVPRLAEWTSKVHEDDREMIIERLRSVWKGGITEWHDEFRFYAPDGSIHTVLDRASIIKDQHGKPIRVIGAIVDITEQKEQEALLRKSNERYDMAAKATNDVIYEWDIRSNTNYWGEGYQTLFGYPRFEGPMPADTWLGKLHPDEMQDVLNSTLTAFANNTSSLTREMRFRCADGTYKMVFDKLMIKYSETGEPLKIYGAMQDITESKRQENAIRNLNEELQKRAAELAGTNAELERFAYVASHDLQEPLRMVSSFLQLLKKRYQNKLDATADLYINYAVDGADRMKSLILDLLEYSRATSVSPDLEETDINEICEQVKTTFAAHVGGSNAEIITGAMPAIRVSRSQMNQLLQNLVGNALKYNESPQPRVEITAKELEAHWQFTVADNGIGIDPKYAEKIFVIFQRLHNKNEFSGTGIGLAICKKIVEKHGGDIWIEPRAGGGSEFSFTIKKDL